MSKVLMIGGPFDGRKLEISKSNHLVEVKLDWPEKVARPTSSEVYKLGRKWGTRVWVRSEPYRAPEVVRG